MRGFLARRIWPLLAFFCFIPGGLRAAIIVDPFLEQFRIGAYSDPDAIELVAGWPRELQAALTFEAAWSAGAAQFFAGEGLPQRGDLVTWRLILPALGSAAESVAWYQMLRGRHDMLLVAGDTTRATVKNLLEATAENTFLIREILAIQASAFYAEGRHEAAAAVIADLLARRRQLAMPVEEAFVWQLRAAHLDEVMRRDVQRSPDLWPLLLDLGPYDANSGWALWVAQRRSRGLKLIPLGAATRELGVYLAGLRKTWLTPDELASAGFPVDVVAGLGGVALAKADLADHFQTFAEPPQDGLFQGYWLRGQRRLHAGDGAAYERLARLPGLQDGHRLDTWRRASERRLLVGDWQNGLADLEQGLGLMDSQASRLMKRRLRHWTEQALVLALAQEKTERAEAVFALASAYLTGEQAEVFAEETAYWRRNLPGDVYLPAAAHTGVKAEATASVEAGRAREVNAAGGGNLLAVADYLADRRWRLWARWGQMLAAQSGGQAGPAPTIVHYSQALATVERMDDAYGRFTVACAAIGRYLRGRDCLAAVADWAIARDVQELSAELCLPPPSPMPDLAADLRGSKKTADLLTLHALLGVSLATGDDRGQVAIATVLPAAGIDGVEKLLFLYPVPAPGALLEALAVAQVDAALLLATARNESLFDPAIRSRAGALGWLQIMPFHYQASATAPGPRHWSQAVTSLAVGEGLLVENARRYGSDPYRTLAAYNAGPGAVKRWNHQLGGRPERDFFLAWIGYAETRRYVEKVLIDRYVYDWILTTQE